MHGIAAQDEAFRARLHRQPVVRPHRLVGRQPGEERLAPSRVACEIVRFHGIDEDYTAGLGQQAVHLHIRSAARPAEEYHLLIGPGIVGEDAGRMGARQVGAEDAGHFLGEGRPMRAGGDDEGQLPAGNGHPGLQTATDLAKDLGGGRRTGGIVHHHQQWRGGEGQELGETRARLSKRLPQHTCWVHGGLRPSAQHTGDSFVGHLHGRHTCAPGNSDVHASRLQTWGWPSRSEMASAGYSRRVPRHKKERGPAHGRGARRQCAPDAARPARMPGQVG